MGFNQNSTFGFGSSGSGGGGGGTVNAADNGLMLVGDTTVQLGNEQGQNEAALQGPREIPLNGHTVDFSEGGTIVRIAANAVSFSGDGVVGNTVGGQGMTLFTSGKVDIGTLPSPAPPDDPEIFTRVRGNSSIGGWLLNQIRVNASQDDTIATEQDSGTMYVKVFDGIAGDRTITLPPAVPGLIFHFGYSGNGTVFIRIVPDGTDFIWFGIDSPTPTSPGDGIENNNSGCITLVCIVPGEWLNMSQTDDGWAAI